MCLQFKYFKNTMGKREIAHNEQFLLFPQCFLPIWRAFCHCYQNCRLQTLTVWKGLKFVVWERVKLNLFCCLQMLSIWTRVKICYLVKPWFLPVCNSSLLKTLWEKEKLLLTSNFSFSHCVFYPFDELSAIFIQVEIVVCKHFEFGRV